MELLMLLKHNLLTILERPAPSFRPGTVRAVSRAGERVRAGGSRPIFEKDMCFRQRVWVIHRKPWPRAQNQVQIVRQAGTNGAQIANQVIDKLVLFCETEQLAVWVPLCNLFHAQKIILVRNIAGHMKTEKSREHNRPLDFSPICIRFCSQYVQIIFIGVAHSRAQSLQFSRIAFGLAGIIPACFLCW